MTNHLPVDTIVDVSLIASRLKHHSYFGMHRSWYKEDLERVENDRSACSMSTSVHSPCLSIERGHVRNKCHRRDNRSSQIKSHLLPVIQMDIFRRIRNQLISSQNYSLSIQRYIACDFPEIRDALIAYIPLQEVLICSIEELR